MIIFREIKIISYSNGTYSLIKNDSDITNYYKKIDGKWFLFSDMGVYLGKSVDFDPVSSPENYALLENEVRKLKLEKLLK